MNLPELQRLPLDRKVELSLSVMREYAEKMGEERCYMSYSGGKDSSVLLHLKERSGIDMPVVYVDTGLEYPEVYRCAIKRCDDVIKGDTTYGEVVKDWGYPVVSKEQSEYIWEARHTHSAKLRKLRLEGNDYGKNYVIAEKNRYLLDAPFEVSDRCCTELKRRPIAKYRKRTGRDCVVTGNRAAESQGRQKWYARWGFYTSQGKAPQCCPMMHWTEQDVLHYIVDNSIEIPSVYGEIVSDDLFGDHLVTTGVGRTGCMYCMFGVQREKHPNRFEQMKKTHPEQYRYGMEDLGLDKVLTYMGVAH